MKRYDQIYKKKDLHWGAKPHDITIKAKKFISKARQILDIGAGEGKDSIYLAKNGFKTFLVDSSSIGLKKARQRASNLNLQIETKVLDLKIFLKTRKKFGAVLAINILQFINQKEIELTMKKIKSITIPGGINVISSFVEKSKEQRENELRKGKYIFRENELEENYKDWEIIFYKENFGKWEDHGRGKHRHKIVRLIAKKPKR